MNVSPKSRLRYAASLGILLENLDRISRIANKQRPENLMEQSRGLKGLHVVASTPTERSTRRSLMLGGVGFDVDDRIW